MNSLQATTQPESEKMCVCVCAGAKRDRRGEGKDERETPATPDAAPEEESACSLIQSMGDS